MMIDDFQFEPCGYSMNGLMRSVPVSTDIFCSVQDPFSTMNEFKKQFTLHSLMGGVLINFTGGLYCALGIIGF